MASKGQLSIKERDSVRVILYPLLFLLAADMLQQIIHKLHHELVNLPTAQTELLQFADDTAIITPAHLEI
jgi:hypothetical protein